ncbi:hypothetical protein GS399_15285 [Pedobacter sp. HMF7647]|uniref:Uncharacterized protein n=1 Tax=Hufsiella arboris TaxID=2695275 RepID=A0A7K1YCM9_9SPHI|nr:hypothetical protein [Hufsiella arboris]MXV52337.1 hypothetical protein [Hufsiella arboris]
MGIHREPIDPKYAGQYDKKVVVKHWLGKTILTAYPDMSKVVPSPAQLAKKSRFKQAVAYARSVISDPRQAAVYRTKVQANKSIYHAAIADFMRKDKGCQNGF